MLIQNALVAQEPDKRARLQVHGAIDKISVLPDESIWLGTRAGEAYYTQAFEQDWHYANIIEKSVDGLTYDKIHKIIGFNQDTILAVGQFSSDGGYNPNSVLQSTDGGKSWKYIKYTSNGTTQIHAVDFTEKGEVWISGGPARFYYSNDFGSSWTEKTKPYEGSLRIYSIFMLDSMRGYVCSQGNKISYTQDYGTSWSVIQTPFNQGKYERPEQKWEYTRVEKVEVIGNFLLAKQWDKVFISDKDQISWKSFGEGITDFTVDKTANKLFAINGLGEILVFDEELQLKDRINDLLIKNVKDLQAVNGNLYVIDHLNNIYKMDGGEVRMKALYTRDHPIPTPQVVKKATFKKWGVTGNHIYNADFNSSEWYRIKVTEFSIKDFRLLNDDEVILWDGISQSYYYNKETDSLSIYHEKKPLNDFLSSKVQRITINGGSVGCFHRESSEISYKLEDGYFVLDTKNINRKDFNIFNLNRKFSYDAIVEILHEINVSPDQDVRLNDFEIKKSDISGYHKILKKKKKSGGGFEEEKFDYIFFKEAINHIDTVSARTLSKVLEKPESMWSTTSNWFVVTLQNAEGQEITFEHNYYVTPKPWFLPWHVKFQNTNFISKNLHFSQLINEMIPLNFMFKEIFSNEHLLFEVVGHLYHNTFPDNLR